MTLTRKDLEALAIMADAPDGLAESNVTSAELGTIYHATVKHLLEAGDRNEFGDFIFAAGRDRYTRPLYKITDLGREILDHEKEASAK